MGPPYFDFVTGLLIAASRDANFVGNWHRLFPACSFKSRDGISNAIFSSNTRWNRQCLFPTIIIFYITF